MATVIVEGIGTGASPTKSMLTGEEDIEKHIKDQEEKMNKLNGMSDDHIRDV